MLYNLMGGRGYCHVRRVKQNCGLRDQDKFSLVFAILWAYPDLCQPLVIGMPGKVLCIDLQLKFYLLEY